MREQTTVFVNGGEKDYCISDQIFSPVALLIWPFIPVPGGGGTNSLMNKSNIRCIIDLPGEYAFIYFQINQ